MIKTINGDSTLILPTFEEESIDLIVTDPPYKIITGGKKDGANSKRPGGIMREHTQLMNQIPRFEDWLPDCYRVLKSGSHAYFFTNALNLIELATKIEQAGFKIHNFLVWQKNNCTPSQFYMKNCEYIIFCRKGRAKYINNIGDKTVHSFDNPRNKVHPTEKPVGLLETYIKNSSVEGDTVLDPFMGSGSTGVACRNTGRKFVGIEIEEDYYQLSNKNIGQKSLWRTP